MAQPADILSDSKKALAYYKARLKDGDWDRFDDLATPDFWVAMCKILRRELVKATKEKGE